MPAKNVTVIEPDEARSSASKPKLILAFGRGKVGTSCFVKWLADRSIERGGSSGKTPDPIK